MSNDLPAQMQAHIDSADNYYKQLPRVNLQEGGTTVVYRTTNKVSALRVLSLYQKEPETIDWISRMSAEDILYDIGANIGLYTIWAAATRKLRAYAFEPESGSYALLCGNIFDNRLGERVRAYCLGLSDKTGLSEIMLTSPDPGTSGHQVMNAMTDTIVPHTRQFPPGVVTTTLDQLVFEHGLPCPTCIKVDVDGLEPAIVHGATRVLADPRVRSVLIEFNLRDALHLQTIDRMTSAGFTKDDATHQKVQQKTTGGNAFIGNIIFNR
ncbi:methyltransferase FkbM family protein [alpha proteobacterium BAL199]|nr:methyltransferase FkbM family protein [alpha proteobacterium BAL199]